MPILSYGQRYEDLYLLRAFGDRTDGFYIDIGAGHPVHDNVSFAFYLKGWRGITAEPNPALDRLSRAIRPRDHVHRALVGAAAGQATYYQVEEWHGLSSMIERYARTAGAELGKAVSTESLPVTTLAALCAEHAPHRVDFLKIDVEGAETDVLTGADWGKLRPKVIVVEAFSPDTFEPSWEAWEPILTANGYVYVFCDKLNRYYVAREESEIVRRFETAPDTFDDAAVMFGTLQHAIDEKRHPDHALADRLARAAMAALPLFDPTTLVGLLTANVRPDTLDRPATPAGIAALYRELLQHGPEPAWVSGLMAGQPTNREVYARIVDTDAFRAACGRICASYAF